MRTRALNDWLGYIRTVHFRSIDMTLERVRSVLERIAAPPVFRVIAVAGTNGKGSCAVMLDALLRQAGFATGVYTSPHLVRFNERIRVDGEAAPDAALCEAFEVIETQRGDILLTYFEFATLAAVHVFQHRAVDFAVMEVGMGGRLDAVNALPNEASLITNVELDHMQWLGNDRESIGYEKAHIMRGGRPAVFNHPDVPQSVLDHAATIGAGLWIRGRDYRAEATDGGWHWTGPRGESWALRRPPLPGAVQIDNAAGALALLSSLEGVGMDPETAGHGLAAARVPGRCEIISRNPLVMVDVAHNLPAIQVLAAQLAAHPVSGVTTAVFGMLKDKNPAGVVQALDGLVDSWRLAGIEDERGQSAEELAARISGVASAPVYCHVDAVAAYDAALREASEHDRIVVFGSFLIAGDILAAHEEDVLI